MFEKKPTYFLKQPNFWTFWRFLLDQLHYSASLQPLANSLKNSQTFETPIYFFQSKNLKFLRFEKSYQFNCLLQQICCCWRFLKLKIFVKKPIFFSKGSQVSNVLRYLTNSVAFYCKFAKFDDFCEKHFLS